VIFFPDEADLRSARTAPRQSIISLPRLLFTAFRLRQDDPQDVRVIRFLGIAPRLFQGSLVKRTQGSLFRASTHWIDFGLPVRSFYETDSWQLCTQEKR